MKKSTIEEFINKSKLVHNNYYDYSLVNYKNRRTKVNIICPIHGIYTVLPESHIKGVKCKFCSNKNIKLNNDTFIEKSEIIHKNKYDYSLVNYKQNKEKIKIICPIHGIFEQTPNSHLSGKGCIKCAGLERLTNEEFIKNMNIIHNYKFDYSLVDYKNNKTKVNIICPEHGIFEQSPNDHRKSGCPKCAGLKKLTTEEFIEKAKNIHKNKYDYSLTDYINNYTKIKIICTIHGIFEQTPNSHLAGKGCIKCAGLEKLTPLEFIKKAKEIHQNKYDYSQTNYNTMFSKIEIICSKHGKFTQTAHNHICGNGCPMCNESKGEKLIRKYLIKNDILFETQKTFSKCKHKRLLPFDFYLIDYNICVEFDGKQHFESIEHFGGNDGFNIRKIRDEIKTNYCEKNKIKLLRLNNLKTIEDILKKELHRNG